MGIAGGRPNMSLYFVGIENEQLVYLDPHTTRPAMEVKPLKEYSEEVRKKGFFMWKFIWNCCRTGRRIIVRSRAALMCRELTRQCSCAFTAATRPTSRTGMRASL